MHETRRLLEMPLEQSAVGSAAVPTICWLLCVCEPLCVGVSVLHLYACLFCMLSLSALYACRACCRLPGRHLDLPPMLVSLHVRM
jgi:hypothetical protein